MNINLQQVAVAAHLFSAVIYSGIFVFAAVTLLSVKKATNLVVRNTLGSLLLLIIGLSAAFITSLMVWLHDVGGGQIATYTNVLWMMFNWVNAVTIASFIAATRVFLLWHPIPCADAPGGCPRLVELQKTKDFKVNISVPISQLDKLL